MEPSKPGTSSAQSSLRNSILARRFEATKEVPLIGGAVATRPAFAEFQNSSPAKEIDYYGTFQQPNPGNYQRPEALQIIQPGASNSYHQPGPSTTNGMEDFYNLNGPKDPSTNDHPCATNTLKHTLPESKYLDMIQTYSLWQNLDATAANSYELGYFMVQEYINMFWIKVHPQFPILHEPTFNAADCHILQLFTLSILGASCLGSSHGNLPQVCIELAGFLAPTITQECFRNLDAELWLFQTKVLFELFQMRHSTLLKTSHPQHEETVQLVRAGVLPNLNFGGSQNDLKSWISSEASRRLVFAVFFLDSLDAILFGRKAIMSTQEINLPLPCDDSLWFETNYHKFQARLCTESPTLFFLDGLKATTTRGSLIQGSFARQILMAGLLNVRLHLAYGRTRSPVTAAQLLSREEGFKSAFEYLRPSIHTLSPSQGESEEILYYVARMSMPLSLSIFQCRIFAGATVLLGRKVTPQADLDTSNYVRNWANTATARDAAFYALRVVSKILTKDANYSAQDDSSLYRPWVLYFATLIIWCFGYALEGPIGRPPELLTHEDRVRDMQEFLRRVGGVNRPDDLGMVAHRNACLGMLMIVRNILKEAQWELLHDASNSLDGCISMSCGTIRKGWLLYDPQSGAEEGCDYNS